MTREIKFRAWDKVLKMLWYPGDSDNEYITFDGRVLEIELAGYWGTEHIRKNDRTDTYDLMQYTGLKDKNGVEIYEGDILEFNWFVDEAWQTVRGSVYYNDGNFKVTYAGPLHNAVRYRNNVAVVEEYQVTHTNRISLNRWTERFENFQVIGNIYEYPHLLERGD